MWIPGCASTLDCWPYEEFVCLFLDVSVAGVDIAFEETDGAIGLCIDVVNVLCPLHI